MTQLKICVATKKDLSILNCLYAEMDKRPLLSETEIVKIWDEIQQVPNYNIYLAHLEPKVVGTFSLLFMPTLMHRNFYRAAILDAVTIATAYRGRGLGRQMIKAALEISAAAGCYKVTFSSNLKRNRVHKFYKSLGFEQHGWSFSYILQASV